jgi:GNAT superfamily N-acetyltransferase
MMRWQEWGHSPEPDDPQWWIDATRREADRGGLPVTYVAIGGRDELLGAVGLGEFDIEERQDRSPWILGLIVRADRRRAGIGRLLLSRIEQHAAEQGFQTIWVANEGRALGFYKRCGYVQIESVELDRGVTTHVFKRTLEPKV